MLSATSDRSRWFRSFSPGTQAQTRLFCFAHAGGGPEVFRSWGRALRDSEVLGVTLPGHDERMMEKSFSQWPALVDALCDAIGPYLDRPFAFLGHSFGARLAFVAARRLEALGGPLPRLVIVAACRCPHIPCPRPLIHGLPEAQFYERVRKFSGAPAEVFQNRRLMRLFEPALRADVKLCESWPASRRTIGAPLAAFCGARDDIDPPGSMRGWECYTESSFEFRTFAGDHFFLRSDAAGVLAHVAALIGETQWQTKRKAELRPTATM